MNTSQAQPKKLRLAAILPQKRELLAAFCAVALAVILPQLCHLIGGKPLGNMLSPMHLPILFIGLLSGAKAGALAGFAAPLVSFALTGMPPVLSLPYMVVELCFYGLTAGILNGTRLPSLVRLVFAQVAGRVARFLAMGIALLFFSQTSLSPVSIFLSVKEGIWGLALQWLLIPPLLFWVKRKK
ncbi:MAG: ECF transporter S component [Clostridia bacterium]|nr:ECF transporter S component [Clostridia bacterium]